jgi:exopolysaccharide biosynthesis polyprenyl glycosylphosphotransferase
MRARTLEIDELTFLSLRGNPHHGWYRLAKRSMDVALGGMALVIFAPLMLVLATLIKLTSRGPILLGQPRTGMGGRSFSMLKFRSMRADAEHATGAVWAVRNDPRCTPLGRFMRRYNLDELPQLLNVLVGHMSLVGPRPERNVFVESFRRRLPTYTQRHRVKAGMTGWAQVNGWRGNTSFRRRLEYDLFYITNWSLWLDLKILGLTLWQSLRPPGAI